MANEVIKIVFKVDDKEITVAEKNVKELAEEVDNVEKSSKKGGVSLKGLGGAATAVAGAAAAAATAVAAFGKMTLDAAREVDQLSKISGLSAEAFQRQAFAARSVGIESDKYADIIKDVNDKVGDFMVTGAGPMADFFDSVGKKVGVTADDFKGLSGDQALGLYVDTLEKANVNQQEASFFMEALASDATALYPLLVNNAEGMNEMGEAAGKVLSQEQIDNARDLNEAFDSMSSTIKNQLMGAFIDVATEAGNFFNLLGTEAEKAAEREIRRLDDEIENMSDSLKRLREGELDSVSESFAQLNDIAVEDNWLRDDEIADQERLVRIMEDKLKAMKQAQLAAFDQKAVATKEADEQERATNAWRERTEGSGTAVPGSRNAADDLLSEITVTATKREGPTGAAKQAAIQKEWEEWLAKRNADKARELEEIADKYGQIADKTILYQDEIAELDLLLEKNRISQEDYNKEIEKLGEMENPWEGLFEELNNFDNLLRESAIDGINQMADSIAEMVVSGKADFKSLAASILQDIAKMIIKMLILKAIQSTMGGLFGMANGGIAPAGRATLVGERGPEIIQPASATRVIPNHAMGGAGGGGGVTVGSINVTLQEREGETSDEQAARIGKAVREEMRGLVIQELGNQSRRGNILNPAPIKAFR